MFSRYSKTSERIVMNNERPVTDLLPHSSKTMTATSIYLYVLTLKQEMKIALESRIRGRTPHDHMASPHESQVRNMKIF